MSKYYPPQYQVSSFQCLHCHVHAHQHWEDMADEEGGLIYVDGKPVKLSLCAKCKGPTLWVAEKIVYPLIGMFPPANEDLPNSVKDIYNEAASIANQSPRAACALLRLAIEMLMEHLGETGSINESIGNLVKKGLNPQVQQSLDIVRVTGNNAVHPGEIDFEDTTDVQTLFNLINVIAGVLITQPKQIQTLYDQLPESSKKAVEKRDGKA